ncbi:DUF1659 domain-containing protein [Furfurilactobacillus curtus]|uniref:DUF1659 domain-containing protein n=1 Tax=Furfurilactobacillus curtus TaxID=1746200 RepID=A0ABQ5JLU2_9LACO
MSDKWLTSSVQFEFIGDGHLLPVKRTYPNVVESATTEQLMKFGQAIASLTTDTLSDTTLIKKEAVAG